MTENKINVVVSFTPEQFTIVAFEAESLEMDVPAYLAYAAHRVGLFEQAIESGYEIIGRNDDGHEITQEEILYGEIVKPLEAEAPVISNEPIRLPVGNSGNIRNMEQYRQK